MKGKTYKIMLNKWDVELCAKTLNVSRRRVERYLNTLMKSAIRDHKSLRMFWSDVIMPVSYTHLDVYKRQPLIPSKAISLLDLV